MASNDIKGLQAMAKINLSKLMYLMTRTSAVPLLRGYLLHHRKCLKLKGYPFDKQAGGVTVPGYLQKRINCFAKIGTPLFWKAFSNFFFLNFSIFKSG